MQILCGDSVVHDTRETRPWVCNEVVKLAARTRGDLAVLRHVATYVKPTSHYVIELKESYPERVS